MDDGHLDKYGMYQVRALALDFLPRKWTTLRIRQRCSSSSTAVTLVPVPEGRGYQVPGTGQRSRNSSAFTRLLMLRCTCNVYPKRPPIYTSRPLRPDRSLICMIRFRSSCCRVEAGTISSAWSGTFFPQGLGLSCTDPAQQLGFRLSRTAAVSVVWIVHHVLSYQL